MKCANCGAEMAGEKCPNCGWAVKTPPENKDALIRVLDFLAEQFVKFEKDMHDNEEDFAHGSLRANLEKKEEEQKKVNETPREEGIMVVLLFLFWGYCIFNWIFGDVTILGLLIRFVGSLVAAFVIRVVLNFNAGSAKKKNPENNYVKARLAVIDAKKALETSYNNRKNSIQEAFHQAIDSYNFLTPDVQNAEACNAMSTYLKDKRAVNYQEAYRLYHQLVLDPEQRRAEMKQAVNAAYKNGEKEGYKEGYSAGQAAGYSSGYYSAQRDMKY